MSSPNPHAAWEHVRTPPEIPQAFIDEIRERLLAGKRIRRNLEPEGRLHIDRPLPFLLVYRRPPKRRDRGTEDLVTGEASYLIASGQRGVKGDLTQLLRSIVTVLGKECQAFLVLEIWSRPAWENAEPSDTAGSKAAFRIVNSQLRPSIGVLEVLEKALKRIRIHRQPASVEIVTRKTASAPGLLSLLPQAEAKSCIVFSSALKSTPFIRLLRPEKSSRCCSKNCTRA